MPRDQMTRNGMRTNGSRAGRAGAGARAGLFAVLGTVLAVFGHHAVAEGAVSWRLSGSLIVAQFAAVWPLARRRYPAAATVVFTLAAQGAMHVALSFADGDHPSAMSGHAAHTGHSAALAGDGHAWHHAGAAMTTVHLAAALVVAWLLHRADARLTAALGTLRILARAAAAALAQVLPRPVVDPDRVLPQPHDRRPGSSYAVAARIREEVLEHAVVRRGPPHRERVPVVHRPRQSRARSFPYQQGVPLCTPPPTSRPVSAVVPRSPAPPR